MTVQSSQQARRRALAEVLERGPVASQEALVEVLAAEGFEATQATLSRDLRALGAVKGPAGYFLGAGEAAQREGELEEALASWLVEWQVALNQVVLHTPAGCAQPLALVLDRVRPGGLLGTIAGDDTILCVLGNEEAARGFAALLEGAWR